MCSSDLWKLDLIARIDARIHAAPAPLASVAGRPLDRRGDEYRPVRATGRWMTGRDTLVQAVTRLGGGWWVLTPLRTAEGTLLVNRGFVADEGSERARPAPPPAGPVTVAGLLRITEPGGGFLRSNDPAADRWYSRDVTAIARTRGLGQTLPFFLDAGASPALAAGAPVGGLTVVTFRNNHLVYALTWFALAGLSITGAVLIARASRTR